MTLADGRRLTARMLAGCDGRGSGTAARAGITRTGWGYGQTALVCALTHERPHDGIAHQVFLPGGPLAMLPLHRQPRLDRLERARGRRRSDRGPD